MSADYPQADKLFEQFLKQAPNLEYFASYYAKIHESLRQLEAEGQDLSAVDPKDVSSLHVKRDMQNQIKNAVVFPYELPQIGYDLGHKGHFGWRYRNTDGAVEIRNTKAEPKSEIENHIWHTEEVFALYLTLRHFLIRLHSEDAVEDLDNRMESLCQKK